MTSLLTAGLVWYGAARCAYATYRSLRSDRPDPEQLMFWATLAVYKSAEPWADTLLGTFLPLYGVWKLGLVALWLTLPHDKIAVPVFRAMAPYEKRAEGAVVAARCWVAGHAVRVSSAAATRVAAACAGDCSDEDLAALERHAAQVAATIKAQRTLRLRRSLEPVQQAAPAARAQARAPAERDDDAAAAARLQISRKSRRRTAFVVQREPDSPAEPLHQAYGGENSPAAAQFSARTRQSRTPAPPKKVGFADDE